MLKFIYGTMGSSKTAQALIRRFDYTQKGFQCILLKPAIDDRSEEIESRIGLKAKCISFNTGDNLEEIYEQNIKASKNIVIVDECQFCTSKQIEELKEVSLKTDVFCYGLKVNVESKLFEGAKRLLELADEFQAIENMCSCGSKAILNILLDEEGKRLKEEKDIGSLKGLTHKSVCYRCWKFYE